MFSVFVCLIGKVGVVSHFFCWWLLVTYGCVGVYSSIPLAQLVFDDNTKIVKFLELPKLFQLFLIFFECRQLSVVGTKLNAYLCCINLK